MLSSVSTLSTSPASSIRILLSFPDHWNGRLIGLGSGGAAGSLDEKSATQYARQGFVSVTSDLGTAPNPNLAGFNNPEVIKDYGHRATEHMLLFAKERIQAKYGHPPSATYFYGLSTGGQQALSLAQRHPSLCNGIIAGVPAHCRVPLHLYFLWNWQHSHTPDGSLLFSKQQLASFRKTTLDYFAPREIFPHARNRFISNPSWTNADKLAILQLAAQRDPSLSPLHLHALRALLHGPSLNNSPLFGGVPPAANPIPSFSNLFLFHWLLGPQIDFLHLDFPTVARKAISLFSNDLNAENDNLDAFRARNGKLIIFSGTQDACVPYHATLAYYNRLIARYGFSNTLSFCHYYLLPGREHFGGPGMQELLRPVNTIRLWVEKDIPPSFLAVSCPLNLKLPLPPYHP